MGLKLRVVGVRGKQVGSWKQVNSVNSKVILLKKGS